MFEFTAGDNGFCTWVRVYGKPTVGQDLYLYLYLYLYLFLFLFHGMDSLFPHK